MPDEHETPAKKASKKKPSTSKTPKTPKAAKPIKSSTKTHPTSTASLPEKSTKKQQPTPAQPLRRKLLNRKSRYRYISACTAIISGIAAILIGIVVLVGCQSSTLDRFDIVSLHTNETYNVRLSFGYFGGCVSIDDTHPIRPNLPPSNDSFTSNYTTHCLSNMYGTDLNDLPEEFLEPFDSNLTAPAKAALSTSLNYTLPLARHVQKDIFHYTIPVSHLILFLLSSTILLTLAIHPISSKKPIVYRYTLLGAILISGFALALIFTVSVGYQSRINGLMGGTTDETQKVGDGGVDLVRGT